MMTIAKESTIQRVRWLLAELLVIVLGILIAFQVDEWQTDRNNRISERESLTSINQDLKIELRELEGLTQTLHFNRQIWLRMMTLLRDNHNPSEHDIISTLERYRGRPLEPTNSAFTSLIESGRLNLVSDGDLRLKLVDFYQVKQRRLHFVIEQHRDSRDEYIEILLMDIDFKIDPEYETNLDYARELIIPPEKFPSHPSLQRVLVDLDQSYLNLIRRIDETIAQMEELKTMIELHIDAI
ncbi:MAG: hypothetical protein RL839_12210 [Gammaproteobacteria bacterium]